MNELIQNLEVKIEPAKILYDLAPIKDLVKSLSETYKGWIVKEEDLKSAADTTAQVKKVSKALSDKRIALAKEFKKPYEDFEAEIKKMCADLDALAKSITDQTDIYEQNRKDGIRQTILKMDEYRDYTVFDERWLNKTTKLSEIQTALKGQIERFDSGKKAIQGLCATLALDSEPYISDLKKNALEQVISNINHDVEVLNRKASEVIFPKNAEEKPILVNCSLVGTQTNLQVIKKYAESIGIKIMAWGEEQ